MGAASQLTRRTLPERNAHQTAQAHPRHHEQQPGRLAVLHGGLRIGLVRTRRHGGSARAATIRTSTRGDVQPEQPACPARQYVRG